MEYKLPYKDIILNLDKKTYILGQDSAEGKTYLFKLLQTVSQRPEERNHFFLQTYQEDLQMTDLLSRLAGFKGDLIMFDRLDLYWCDELRDIIRDITGKICILLDLKSNDYIMQIAAQPAEFLISKEWVKVQTYANDF